MGRRLFGISIVILFCTQSFGAPKVKVAFSLNKPPYVLEKSASGLEVEVLTQVFKEMHMEIEPVFQPPARALSSLKNGTIDAMATVSAKQNFHYSVPYITFQNAAWSLKSRNLKVENIESLAKYSVIGFQNAAIYFGPQYAKVVAKNGRYQEFADQFRQLKMLVSGRADLIICEERLLYANKKIFESQTSLHSVEIEKHAIFPESAYSVAFRDARLRDSFDAAFHRLQNRGVIRSIFKKYND